MKAYEFDFDNTDKNAFILTKTEGFGDTDSVYDSYWRDKILNIFKSIVPVDFQEFNLRYIKNNDSKLDMANLFAGIKNAVSILSMFPCKIVIIVSVSDFQVTSEQKGENSPYSFFKELLHNLPDDIVLVVADYKKVTKEFIKLFTEIDCSKTDRNTTYLETKKLIGETQFDDNAIQTLMEYSEYDMGRISLEITKLKSYAAEDKVRVNDVVSLVPRTVENKVFDMTNALGSNNKKLALDIANNLVNQGIPYSVLITTLLNSYRRILYSMLSGLSDEALAGVFGVKPYAVMIARKTAKQYTSMRIMNIVKYLSEVDFKFKSGGMTEQTAFESSLAKLLML